MALDVFQGVARSLEWRQDLAELHNLDSEDLGTITKEALPAKQWQRHQALLDKNQSDALTDNEQEDVANLHTTVDRFVFRRSHAVALLKWRGYALPFSETASAP